MVRVLSKTGSGRPDDVVLGKRVRSERARSIVPRPPSIARPRRRRNVRSVVLAGRLPRAQTERELHSLLDDVTVAAGQGTPCGVDHSGSGPTTRMCGPLAVGTHSSGAARASTASTSKIAAAISLTRRSGSARPGASILDASPHGSGSEARIRPRHAARTESAAKSASRRARHRSAYRITIAM